MKKHQQGSAMLIVLLVLSGILTAWYAAHMQLRLMQHAMHFYKKKQHVFWLTEGLRVYAVALCKQRYAACIEQLRDHKELIGVVNPWPPDEISTHKNHFKGEMHLMRHKEGGIEIHAMVYDKQHAVGHAQCVCGYDTKGDWCVSDWQYTHH